MKQHRGISLLLCASSLAFAVPAFGQDEQKPNADEQQADDQGGKVEDIVVTGTLLRGIAPVGSATVGLNSAEIAATGATTTNDLLATIPQISSFGLKSSPGANMIGGANAQIGQYFQVTPPNLRDFFGPAVAQTTVTLMLVDGHRVVNVGTNGASPDPEIVPPGAIERVEIVLDGGSSLYGSDAIGGVINFITKKKFDGVNVKANYGIADNYYTFDTNVTAGTSWEGGNAYLSYNYAKNDNLYGIDREIIRGLDYNTGIPVNRQCDLANITANGRFYALPGLVQGTINSCDATDFQSFVPEQQRHSLLGSFNQDLSPWLNFEVKGFYTHRITGGTGGTLFQNGSTVTVRPGYFYYRNLPGADANAVQTVQFNYAPVRGHYANYKHIRMDEWGITPQFTADLGGRWQLRLMGNYGWSTTEFRNQDNNLALQAAYAAGTTAATAIDYYNIANPANAALIDNVLNYQQYGYGRSTIGNARAVIDGPLFALPGGDVRVAGGAEYTDMTFKTKSGSTVLNGEDTLAFRQGKRNVKAVFGEIFVPIFGPDNATTLLHTLNLSASIRYDKYSDFGSTTNPKFGITWAPFEGIQIRGSYAKSFNAPSISSTLGAGLASITASNTFYAIPPNGAAPPVGSYNLTLTGAVDTIRPQTGESWSVGLDILPTLLNGFHASLNYYKVTFANQIGNPPIFDGRLFWTQYSQFGILNPTEAQVRQFLTDNQAQNAAAILTQFFPAGGGGPRIYEILDYRTRNLSATKISGLDFSLGYEHPFKFGSVDFNIDGNYKISRDQAGNGVDYIPIDLDLESRLKFAATLGTTIGKLRAQARLNYIAPYHPIRAVNAPQDRVEGWTPLDLYFRYDLAGTFGTKDLSLSLTVNNLFNEKPPASFINGNSGFVNGNPIGRMIQFGLNAGF
jgi:iron complex outermembrane receptor protein